MSGTSLESSIREESARLLAAIGEKEAGEMRRLEESFRTELESFTDKVEADTQARLRQELARMENRANLERRKLKLLGVDNFIGQVMDAVVSELRLGPDYKRFMLDAVLDAARQTPAEVEVGLMAEDLALESELRKTLKTAGLNGDMAITRDATIKWGGCLVRDVLGGRVFNYTLERIYYRKTLMIRREIMKILLDHSRAAISPISPPAGQ
jgi:vacuolar-type H+-ATPase subunit E/Vma4